MPEDRRPLGAPADVPELRQGRLLRQLAEPACHGALPRGRSPADPLRRAGRGLVLLLRRRPRVRAPGTVTKVVFDVSVSLDGFLAGPDSTLEQPLGAGGEELHEWLLATRGFRERHGLEGGDAGPDSDLVDEHVRATGATIMGRRMFSGGEGPWEEDP